MQEALEVQEVQIKILISNYWRGTFLIFKKYKTIGKVSKAFKKYDNTFSDQDLKDTDLHLK